MDPPQWGAVDAEIKVPAGENTELKCSPFKAWSRSMYSQTCYAYCQEFLPCSFLPSGPFTCIFSKTSHCMVMQHHEPEHHAGKKIFAIFKIKVTVRAHMRELIS